MPNRDDVRYEIMWNEGGGDEHYSEQQEEIRADMQEAWLLPGPHQLAEMDRCDTFIADNLNLVPPGSLTYSDWFDLVKESFEFGEATALDISSSDLYDAAMRACDADMKRLEAEESATPESGPSGP